MDNGHDLPEREDLSMSMIGTALSGMQAGQARLKASASNVANINSAGPIAPPATFGPLSGPGVISGSKVSDAPELYRPVRTQQSALASGGVTTHTTTVNQPYTLRYQPDSLAADSTGMVATPNVDLTQEAVEQMTAVRDFQANAKLLETADALTGSTLEIWG